MQKVKKPNPEAIFPRSNHRHQRYFDEYVLDNDLHQCPECLSYVSKEELDMFGGLCEDCYLGTFVTLNEIETKPKYNMKNAVKLIVIALCITAAMLIIAMGIYAGIYGS
jgi:hypothetical protein